MGKWAAFISRLFVWVFSVNLYGNFSLPDFSQDVDPLLWTQEECDAHVGSVIWWQGSCRSFSVAAYAPLAYLHSEEIFNPSSVEFFLPFMEEQDGYLTTRMPLGCPTCRPFPFLFGQPVTEKKAPPVYAMVSQKSETILDVMYWFFYPYNFGKKFCIGVKIEGVCFGCRKEFGDHVGDWEHVTVRFENLQPTQVYLSYHASGIAYPYGDRNSLRYIDTHPVVYIAKGSHGVWGHPGNHIYHRVRNGENLTDETNVGTPWYTWNNIQSILYKPDVIYEPSWINYRGNWGNRKDGCRVYEKLSGECQLNGGPSGPIVKYSTVSLELQ